MDDGVDPVLREQRRNAGLIAGVADDDGTSGATDQSKPVVRLSSTTTRSPASASA